MCEVKQTKLVERKKQRVKTSIPIHKTAVVAKSAVGTFGLRKSRLYLTCERTSTPAVVSVGTCNMLLIIISVTLSLFSA